MRSSTSAGTTYQVDLRGARVEPGEIEAVLRGHGGVRDVVVALTARPSGDQALVAHVVRETSTAAGPGELRQFLATRLPAHMLPNAFAFLDALPLMPNGKVDRRALAASAQTWTRPDTPYVAPRGPLETLIARVWAEVLGREPVGAMDPFLDLGGDSLLAARVVARIGGALGAELHASSLLAAATVADQAIVILQELSCEQEEAEAARLLDRIAPADA